MFFCVITCWAHAAAAQVEPDRETVTQAVQSALSGNPQISIAQSRKDSAAAGKLRAFGQFLPDIEASAAYEDDSWRSPSLRTAQNPDGATLALTATQPIFQGLTSINRFREARARFSQADQGLLAVREQIALEAAIAHAGVVLARAIVEHRIENLSLVNRQFEIAERRQQAGAQTRTDVEQARTRRAQAEVDLGAARARLAAQEAAYTRTTGRPAAVSFAEDRSEIIDPSLSLDDALFTAHHNNAAISSAEAALQAAQYAKRAAKGDFSPRVTLEGSYFNRTGEDPLKIAQGEEYQFMARVRMPIFNQGRNIASLKSARASIDAEQAQLTNTRAAVDESVMRSWRQLNESKARRAIAKLGIEAAEHSVKGLQIEYEAGQRTVIDVLNGQRDLVLSQISLSQAEFDVRVSQYELAASIGRILGAFTSDSKQAASTPN